MIKAMSKVRIIGPRTLLDDCIRALHETAVVHVETAPTIAAGADAFLKRLPIERDKSEKKERLDRAVVRLKEAAALLSPPLSYRVEKVDAAEIFIRLDALVEVEAKVKLIHARIDELRDSLSLIEKYERLLGGFLPIVPRFGGFGNFDIVGLTIEKRRADAIRLLEDEVNKITGGACEMQTAALDETSIGVVIAFQHKFEEKIRRLLTGRSINEIRLPDAYEEMTFVGALKEMQRKKHSIPEALRQAGEELEDISKRWYGVIAGLRRSVEDAIDEVGALTYAAQSSFAFAVEGYLPVEKFAALKARFAGLFGQRVLVSDVPITDKEAGRVPVCIENPAVIRPFEVFLSAVSLPRYGSVDPTIYLALFFPVFFGIIVGDAGYGVVLFVLGLWARRKFSAKPFLRDVSTILAICSVWAVLFGLLFGEIFGDLGARLGILPHPVWFHRDEALKTLLLLTLGMGACHVVLGLVVGAASNFSRKRHREATAKAAQLAAIFAFFAAAAASRGYLSGVLFTPLIVLLAASLAVLVLTEGVIGPLESIKSLGNMLSYMRLMAVGAASVVMANVANKIGGRMKSAAVGIIVAALIHLINIALSLLSPVIQSMRLHYVEFFGKFYEAGGRRYAPFRKR